MDRELTEQEKEIAKIIYDEVPLRTTCPHCERDFDAESVLVDPKGRLSSIGLAAWRELVSRVAKKSIDIAIERLKEMNK